MCAQLLSVCRLRVVADADPNALARILERFQNLNVLPRRVTAEFGINDTLHVEVDVTGLSEEEMRLITAKIFQAPSIVNAYWHRI